MEDFDDDFGDIYADVEVQASSAIKCISGFAKSFVEPMGEGGGEDNDVTVSKELDTIRDDLAKLTGSDENNEKEINADNGSDSEDDLNIVLNDEDCKSFPIVSGGNMRNGAVVAGGFQGDDEDDHFVIVGEGSEGSEPGSNGHGGERGNGLRLRGVYNSQYPKYKYMRPHGAAFPNNIRGDGPVGIASYSSMLARGDRDESPCNQRKSIKAGQVVRVCGTANLVAGQSGNCFSLPWYRSILDVNIDAFEKKPWRFPGVDITDFFNFGFNEDTWKEYCKSLEQLKQQALVQTGMAVCGPWKMNQACEAKCEYEKGLRDTAVEYQVGLQSTISLSSEFIDSRVRRLEMPKGRAIQVEDSAGERQPSMDVRRSCSRDSDVIQINVLDIVEDSPVSGKEEVDHIDITLHAVPENGNLDAVDSKDIYSSGKATGDEPSVQSQEGYVRKLDRCSLLSTAYNPMNLIADEHKNEKILDTDAHYYQKVKVYPSEGVTEGMETVNITQEGISRNSSSGDKVAETELSLSDNDQLSLDLSCYRSDSEASRDSVSANSLKTYSPVKRPSLNLSAELPVSVNYCKKLKISSAKSKSDEKLRNKGSARELEHSHRKGGSAAKQNTHPEDNDDASHMLAVEDLGDSDTSLIRCCRQKERNRVFRCRDREDLSYHREKEFSSCYGSEKFAENDTQKAHIKCPYRKGDQSPRSEMDSCDRRKWDEKVYFNEKGSHRGDDKERDQDWYHSVGGRSANYSSGFTYGESRHLNTRYSSCSAEERGTWWRRKHGELQLRKRTNNKVRWLDYKHGDNVVPEKYGRPASFTDRNMDYLEEKCERQLPDIGREFRNSGRRDRYSDSSPLYFDNPWSQEIKDEYQRHMDFQSWDSWFHRESYVTGGCQHDIMSPGNDVFDLRLTEKYGRHRRRMFSGEVRDNGWLASHNNGDDLEDCITYPDDQDHVNRRRYGSQSRFLQWSEDELILRHWDDKVSAGEASLSYEKTTGHERIRARYGSARDGMQVQQHRLKMIKTGSSTKCNSRSSKIINRHKHEQAMLRCRDSVDLVIGEGKSPRRRSKVGSLMSNGRSGNTGQKIDKDQSALMDSNEPHMETAVESNTPRTESSQKNHKWFDKFPIVEHNEDLDIEEGQIVTEHPNGGDSFRCRDFSQDAGSTSNIKKRILHGENGSNGTKVIGGYDQQRILETLAKMEKRRERFKESIAVKNEPGKSPKPQVDLIIDAEATKQQRPARKRRWGGS